jgi:predicted TIM-barrel fold metal-dependent hydrolase
VSPTRRSCPTSSSASALRRFGAQKLVYASDYYHWDCRFPDTVKLIAERTDISEADKKQIFSSSAAQLYALSPLW